MLRAVRRSDVVIADQGQGEQRLRHREFLEGCGDGVLLTLSPDMLRLRHQQDDRSKINCVGRMMRLAPPYGGHVIFTLALNMAIGLIGRGISLLMQVLAADILVRRDAQMLRVLGIGMFSTYGFRTLINFLKRKISPPMSPSGWNWCCCWSMARTCCGCR